MDIGHCLSNEHYELLYKSPEPVIKSVQKNYPSDSLLKLCLGVNNLWKNMYSISLPFTVKISYNKDNNQIIIYEEDSTVETQAFSQILNPIEVNDNSHPIIQISLEQFFVSDSSCNLSVLPPINEMHKDMWREIRLICGQFNIFDWQRNLNFSFEWFSPEKPLTIKKGEPICYVQFNSPNLDESFNIKKIPFDGALKDQYNKCKGSRFVIKSNTQELLDYNRENRPDELVGSKCPYTKFKKWLKR